MVAAIYATPALILQNQDLLPVGNMAGLPGLKEQIAANK